MPISDDGSVPPVGAPTPAASADDVEATDGVDATEGVAPAAGEDMAVAEALRTGEVTPEEAQARIIDEVVRKQLGPDAPAELVESVRAEVAALLEADPALVALLRQ